METFFKFKVTKDFFTLFSKSADAAEIGNVKIIAIVSTNLTP